jgi:hypothetical protein
LILKDKTVFNPTVGCPFHKPTTKEDSASENPVIQSGDIFTGSVLKFLDLEGILTG